MSDSPKKDQFKVTRYHLWLMYSCQEHLGVLHRIQPVWYGKCQLEIKGQLIDFLLRDVLYRKVPLLEVWGMAQFLKCFIPKLLCMPGLWPSGVLSPVSSDLAWGWGVGRLPIFTYAMKKAPHSLKWAPARLILLVCKFNVVTLLLNTLLWAPVLPRIQPKSLKWTLRAYLVWHLLPLHTLSSHCSEHSDLLLFLRLPAPPAHSHLKALELVIQWAWAIHLQKSPHGWHSFLSGFPQMSPAHWGPSVFIFLLGYYHFLSCYNIMFYLSDLPLLKCKLPEGGVFVSFIYAESPEQIPGKIFT